MKPEQFIREFGVEKAREVSRLVASITAIKELGGIDAAKALQRRAKYSWFFGEIVASQKLKQTIRDHESIYGGGDES
ncbi:hypothetical protein [Acinetobacter baumannii]|uniref:hypothetical protein n=1 Tax=Acinetobacter baumannii TaxID=470 RepID=UPI0021605F74|nr:hypothetical protein [Acinetobacter baumannii]MCE6122980.1 hypothetical protein [Acinetobacter baumannii]MCE6141605.1 hypothetical protein [Acinetobacter baumannii]MDA3524796.1 hypothetical protein [Acinetobacter baumannii]MDK6140304.1 hypothetical protein [Acinetobacter baumannii]HCA4942575.1 hypothetical protein [Acinetobacter baumannii]